MQENTLFSTSNVIGEITKLIGLPGDVMLTRALLYADRLAPLTICFLTALYVVRYVGAPPAGSLYLHIKSFNVFASKVGLNVAVKISNEPY